MTSDPGDLGPWREQALIAMFPKLPRPIPWPGLRPSTWEQVERVALALKGASDSQRERDAKIVEDWCSAENPLSDAIRAARIRLGGNQNEEGE